MNTNKIPTYFYTILFLLLILFSFYNFAPVFFPLLNSDTAVTALMSQGLSLPGDLYLWGQARNGSLVPLLANILVEAYKFPPLLAVSVVHYAILIAGFFSIASFFRNRNLKVILALVWFFPCWHFLDQILPLSGTLLSMIAFALYSLKKMDAATNRYMNLLWLSLGSLSLILSVWVSDLAIVSLLVIALIVLWKYMQVISKQKLAVLFRDRNTKIKTGIAAAWLVLGTAFIIFAKHNAADVEGGVSHSINHPGEILSVFKVILFSFWKVLTFSSDTFTESVFLWSALAGIPVILRLSNTRSHFLKFCSSHKLLVFFTLNAVLLFIILVMSHPVYLSGTASKSFSLVYVMLWIAFLLYIEYTGSHNRQLRMIILAAVALIGAVSSFSKFYVPERMPSRVTALADFRKLGDFGLISGYENAYVIASTLWPRLTIRTM
jgi:hypothetical protein